jgi:hypothetical protein
MGDASVLRRSEEDEIDLYSEEGDASVPTLLYTTPAPTRGALFGGGDW